MKSEKFIQFFDEERRPILGKAGIASFDKRIKTNNKALVYAARKGKVPQDAAYWAIHQTLLKSIIKLTELYPVNEKDNNNA